MDEASIELQMMKNLNWNGGARVTLERIRASLQARLEGRNEGGDIEVMRLVDEIEQKAFERGLTNGLGY